MTAIPNDDVFLEAYDDLVARFMRADTYLITRDGAENMNRYSGGIVTMR